MPAPGGLGCLIASSDRRPVTNKARWRQLYHPYAATDDVGLVVAIARYPEDALAEAYRRHAGAVFALAERMLWERMDRRGDGAGGVPPALGASGALRPHHVARSARSCSWTPTRAVSTGSVPTRGAASVRSSSARAAMVADYDVDLEAWDLTRRRPGARSDEHACPTASGRRSSSRTSVATRTARWRGSSNSPRGRSRAGSAPASMRLRKQLLDRGIDESWIVN